MFPYYVLVLTPTIISLSNMINRRKESKKVINSFFLIWIIMLMLRDTTIGADLINYKRLFIKYGNMTTNQFYGLRSFQYINIEFGFVLFCRVLSLISKNFQWFIIATSLITVLPLWWYYYNETTSCYLLLITSFLNIGLFGMYFSGIRQLCAMAFTIPAFLLAKEGKVIKFLIIVFIASLFHQSALILLLMYPVMHLKIKKTYYLLLIIPGYAIMYIFRAKLFNLFSSIFQDRFSSSISNTGAGMFLIMTLSFLVLSFILPDKNKLDDSYIGLRNILLLSCILQMFASLNPVAMRINYYYLIFTPLTLTKVIEKSKNRNRRLSKILEVIMILFFIFYFFYKSYVGNDIMNIFPYVPFWESI